MFQQMLVSATGRGLVLVALRVVTAGVAVVQATPDTAAQHGTNAAVATASGTDPFVDPLDEAAVMHQSIAGRPLMSVALAGGRLVGVGMRGLIAISDDQGKTWTQASTPVRSDLLAVSFPTASEGWVVGHDGVVLHSVDAGKTWVRQFDGRMAATTLIENYRKRVAAGDTALQPYLDQLALNYKAGPSLPLLGVTFRDALHGFAVGPFGMAIATDDGGRTWVPILDRIDNPDYLHLDAIAQVAGDVYIAAEKGTVFRLDPQTGKFHSVATGYAGSFFGITGNEDVLLAYGLRGTIYRSTDRGATWNPVQSPLRGTVTGAAYVPQRREFVLVTTAGEIAAAESPAEKVRLLKTSRPTVITGVHALPGSALVLLSGLDGMSVAALQ
jgi:photosystem II stability/assembly factor-like uncharacterized protein